MTIFPVTLHPTSLFECIKSNSSLSKFYPKPSLPCIPPRLQLYIWNPFVMSSIVINRSSLASIRFQSLRHEDYIFIFDFFSSLSSPKCIALHTFDCIYRVSSSSLSDKIRVIPWWFACYSYFNLPIFLSIPFFSLKLIAEVIEKLFVLSTFYPMLSSSSNLIKMISITGTNGFISRRLALEFRRLGVTTNSISLREFTIAKSFSTPPSSSFPTCSTPSWN